MSTTTLHQRRPYEYTTMNQQTSSTNNTTEQSSPLVDHQHTLTSSTLLKSNPIHHSKVFKLKTPFIYSVLPSFLLTVLQIILYPILKIWNIQLKPFWVERYFILIGNYLYKFEPNSRGSMGKNNMKMKGSPIELRSMNVESMRLSNDGTNILISSPSMLCGNYQSKETMVLDDIPPNQNCSGYFSIIVNGKSRYYATSSQIETQTWINTLHQARQECITTSMGHSKIPMTKAVEYVNMMGKKIVDRKERVRNLIRKKELDEIELMCLNGGSAGGLPRGYFG